MIWKSKFNQLAVQFIDFVTVIIGFYFSYLTWYALYHLLSHTLPPLIRIENIHFMLIFLTAILYIYLFRIFGAYKFQRFTSLLSEFLIVVKVTIIAFLSLIMLIYLLKLGNIPRTIILLSFIEILSLLIIQKSVVFLIAKYYRKSNHDRKRILIFGTGDRTNLLIEKINTNFAWGLDIIGIITSDESRIGEIYCGKKVIDTYNNLENTLKTLNPQEVIITLSTARFSEIRTVIDVCESEGVQVRLISDFFNSVYKNLRVDNIYGLNIVSFNRKNQNEYQLFFKRIIDIIGALVAIILFLPLMFFSALLILFQDGRPIFYKWRVVGLEKKPFTSWKFRTMVRDADKLKKELEEHNEMNGPVFKITNDPRILKCGQWLRKWSIDETPQFFSVLKGDMSLVGPRPAGPHELVRYQSWQRRKLSIKPGITCLWQAYGRNDINDFDDWVKMDLDYIDNWNLWLDIKIICKTLTSVIKGTGK